MSKLFTKLDTAPAVKVWDDAAFEALYNDPKCYNFGQALGRKAEAWKAWYSFLERNKLNVDYTVKEPHWLMWLYFQQFGGRSLEAFPLPPSIAKQFSEFKAFYEDKQAKEQKERDIAEAERRTKWRKELKRREAETDSARIAFRQFYSCEDLALVDEGKKELKDCRQFIEETPFDTTKCIVNEHWVKVERGPEKGKVLDVLVECTNFGLTYSPDDMKAINEGRKEISDCKPIVKEYPVPVITVNEERKRSYIEGINTDNWRLCLASQSFYESSDAELMRKSTESAKQQARYYLRKRGEDRHGKLSGLTTASTEAMELARKFLRRPKPKADRAPEPPALPPTAARESKVKNRPSTSEKAES